MQPDPREGRWHEALSGGSRCLNGILGGDGAVTLSARAWDDHLHGRRSWPAQVIDAAWRLAGEHDHCRTYWEWHATPRVLVAAP